MLGAKLGSLYQGIGVGGSGGDGGGGEGGGVRQEFGINGGGGGLVGGVWGHGFHVISPISQDSIKPH